MCLPSFLINTLQGGFNKRPCLVPGSSGVWLSQRAQLSCRFHAALQYSSSSVCSVHWQLQRTQISCGLFCAVIYYALLLVRHCLGMKAQEQREGWFTGDLCPVGRAVKGCSWPCVICFVSWEIKLLRKWDTRGGESTEPEAEQRMGITYFFIDNSAVLLRGRGGS